MRKYQKEEKGFCKTQKYELQLSPAACLWFPQKRVRTFPGGLAQTPSAISRCLRATSFPRHFAAAFHSSNTLFFSFSFFHHFSLSFFPSFFFHFSLFFLLFFRLHFLCSRLFLSSFFLFSFFSLPNHITLHVFCVHHPKGCKTERSSVSRSRSTCPWRGFGAVPRILFFFSLCIALCMHAFCQAGRRILGAAAGDVHT